MRMRRTRVRGGRRRGRSLLWISLGLVGVGLAAALASRRHPVFEDWDLDETSPGPRREPEGFEDLAAAEAPEGEALWVAGPAGNLYVRDGGPGVENGGLPMVFLHSLAGNGGQWALQLDHLRRDRRALALDLRGHGESDPADDGDYTIEGMAHDVTAVVDQLDVRRFVLAGHSLGSLVAIEYASRHPDRVAGLLLVDPNGDLSGVPREQIEASYLAPLREDPLGELELNFRQLVLGGDPDAGRWVLEDLRLTHEDAVVGAVESAAVYRPLPALARYAGPRLSVISEINRQPYSLHNLLPDLPVQLLRGTGHWLMMDRPELFNQVVDEFLDEVEGRE